MSDPMPTVQSESGLFVGKALSKADPVFLSNPNLPVRRQILAQMTVVRGQQIGEVYHLTDGITLFGRIEGCMLRDVLASRQHMQVVQAGDGFVLTDLDSTNGTFVNGQKVSQPVILRHGDFIRIGETILAFERQDMVPAVLGHGAALHGHSGARATQVTRRLTGLRLKNRTLRRRLRRPNKLASQKWPKGRVFPHRKPPNLSVK